MLFMNGNGEEIHCNYEYVTVRMPESGIAALAFLLSNFMMQICCKSDGVLMQKICFYVANLMQK